MLQQSHADVWVFVGFGLVGYFLSRGVPTSSGNPRLDP